MRADLPVQILALFGLAFLLFLAGLEIDVHQLRGRLLRFAVLGYLVTMVLGYGAGASFAAGGWVSEPLLLAITLSATSLGLVVPALKDAGQSSTRPGPRRPSSTATAAACRAPAQSARSVPSRARASAGNMATKCEPLSVWPTADSASATSESASARSPRFTASSARYPSA